MRVARVAAAAGGVGCGLLRGCGSGRSAVQAGRPCAWPAAAQCLLVEVAWRSAGCGLVADHVRRFARNLLGHVLGRVEVGQLLVALLQDVDGIDETRLMEEDARSIETNQPSAR